MIRRPPRSTRTDTLFPYTTLFLSLIAFGRIASVSTLSSLIVPSGFIPAGAPTVAPSSMVASRSEEHTSELQSLMRISYAVFCLKKKKKNNNKKNTRMHRLDNQHISISKTQAQKLKGNLMNSKH